VRTQCALCKTHEICNDEKEVLSYSVLEEGIGGKVGSWQRAVGKNPKQQTKKNNKQQKLHPERSEIPH